MRQGVFDILDKLNIEYEVTEHKAVYTVDEADSLDLSAHGKGTKNLFLRDDKKRNYFILVLCNDKRADLKAIRAILDSRPLTFASEEALHEMLKLYKGAVTPFGVINDAEHKVQVIFDNDIFGYDRVGEHPNDNTATLWLNPYDLKKAIEYSGSETKVIDLGSN